MKVKPKVLLVDDEPDKLNLLAFALQREGYEVVTASDGEAGLRAVEEHRPDLIITDVMMPGMDGYEMVRRVRSNPQTRFIPIIIQSAARASERDIRLGYELGAVGYITDPTNVDLLRAQARNALELKHHLNDLQAKAGLPPTPHSRNIQVDNAGKEASEESIKGETTVPEQKVPPQRPPTNKPKDPYRLTGTILSDKYELIEYAGGGGMGAVYRALRKIEGDIVAAKILKPDVVARSPEYAELFERETKNARSLDHPHIVKVFDSDKDDDLSYMVMEWVEGSSIEDVITQGQLSIPRISKIFKQVCSALASAHERGIIHLDLKPANILLINDAKPDDFVKVIDFGLSRLISKESGTTVTKFRGTHQYCSPEQFGGRVSHRSDIYSLGATLYHLLTGVIPFGTSYINAKIHPNLELPEIPSVTRQRDLPPAIDVVLKRALNKNPNLRQQSATELFEEFHAAISPSGTGHQEVVQQAEAVNQKSDNHPPQDARQIKIPAEVDTQGVKILSHAIGIETLGGVFTKLIPEGTPIPHQTSEIFSTATDGQTSVEIHVLTGLRPLAQQNLSLGKFHLIDIPPSPRGVPQIEVTFDVNIHGVLKVSARDMSTGREQKITITSLSGPSREEIDEILREARKRSEADAEKREESGGLSRNNRIDYVSRGLRAASIYPIAEELLQHLEELKTGIEQSKRSGELDPSLSEELDHLQGEINGLFKLSGSDISAHLLLKEAQTLLLNLRDMPNPAEAGAPAADDEKPDEDSEYSYVLKAAQELKIRDRQRRWRSSEEGVASAQQEVNMLYASLERRVKVVNAKLAAAEAPINVVLSKENDHLFVLSSGGYNLSIQWDCKSDNTLEGSALLIRGYTSEPDGAQFYTVDYQIHLNRDLVAGWKTKEESGRFESSGDIAKDLLEYLLRKASTNPIFNE